MSSDVQLSLPKERGKRLRLLRKMSGLTLEGISDKYSIGVSTIKYWECAKNQGISSKGAKKIILAMQNEGVQCSYMWLMHGIGLPPQFIDSYSGDKKADIGVEQIAYEEEKSIENEIAVFCEQVSGAITLTIFDDGMEPLYSSGHGVGGRRLYDVEMEKAVGKDCIIETADKQILCRRVMKADEPGVFNLYCINPCTSASPPHIYGAKLVSVAPISRVWRRIIL